MPVGPVPGFLSAEAAIFVSVEQIGLATMIGLYSAVALVSSKMLNVRYRVAFTLFAFAYLPLFIFRALGYLLRDVLSSGGEGVTFGLSQIGVHLYHQPCLSGMR